MILDQVHHQQCHGAGGRRDHGRATAYEGSNGTDTEGSIEANLGVNSSDDGERNGLGNEGQCNDETSEYIRPDI
ncbi:hypothetical protein D3C87_1808240 [compost metagenome]